MKILCISKGCLIVRTEDPVETISTYTMMGWEEVDSLKDYRHDWDKNKFWIVTFAKGSYLKSLQPINRDYIKKYGECDNY